MKLIRFTQKGLTALGASYAPWQVLVSEIVSLQDIRNLGKGSLKLAEDIMQYRLAHGLPNKHAFKTGEEYFHMWLNNEKLSVEDQRNLLSFGEE